MRRRRQTRCRFSPRGTSKPKGEPACVTPPYSLRAVRGVCIKTQKPMAHGTVLEGKESLFLRRETREMELELFNTFLFLIL